MRGRRRLAALWVLVQVAFLAGWSWREEARSEGGTTVLVAPEPVDPRDLLRGQYVDLRYAFSRPFGEGAEAPPSGSTVWVVLREEGGLHVPARAEPRRPEDLAAGEVALRGTVRGGRFVLGVERYFVPEGTEPPERMQDTLVRLRIGDDGEARIDTLLVDGRPWP